MNKLFEVVTGSLYSKLTLALISGFLILGFVFSLLIQQLTTKYQNEVEQKLHLELAAQIVSGNPILKDGKIDEEALSHAFHSMMVLGPSFEFYLLNPGGVVQIYSANPDKIKKSNLSLIPIQQFLSGDVMLPILGDDPRSENKKKIFSVAPIFDDSHLVGYLYIIIGGEIYDNVVDLLKGSHIAKISTWNLTLALVFIALTILLVFGLLTRPLRQLTNDIQQLKIQGFNKPEQSATEPNVTRWNPNSKDEIQKLGSSYQSMAEELRQQYQKVKNTDELRKELISYVSHDLRTPLASLQGYLETWQLNKDSLPREQSEQLINTALRNAHQMSNLVEQLFELAHLDSDNVDLTTEPVSIAELIQDVMQQRSLEVEAKEIEFQLTPKDPSLRVYADIARLESVFANLIDNAIRHCKSGDIIKARISEFDFSHLLIEISDTGTGIPENELSNIFNPHFRASNSIKNSRLTNSGLGLAISHRIVALHGSNIEVCSQLGEGSTFSFKLPKLV